jgi:formamidopyrimidine-DNA glycosylase
MPELPEVETIAQSLKQMIVGKTISAITLFHPPLLKLGLPSRLEDFIGRRITDVNRRGKYLIMDTGKDFSLVLHLKMTGQIVLAPCRTAADKHTRMTIQFKGMTNELRFRDIRKFGNLYIMTPRVLSKHMFFQDLGPEPLKISMARFKALFMGRKTKIKSLLLNQAFLAGIGNIYADEILHASKIHPLTPASALNQKQLEQLYLCMRDILDQAVIAKGSSIRDYLDVEGIKGRFQDQHKVYQRENLACHSCRTPIQRMRINGRSSHFCPCCQPPANPPPPFP